MDEPTPEQQEAAFHEDVRARLEQRLKDTHLGRELNARGIATVSLNDAGEIVEHLPDGTSRPYEPS
jgi:hypothetical protein